MKRIISLILLITILSGVFTTTAFASNSDVEPCNDLSNKTRDYFLIVDGTAEISAQYLGDTTSTASIEISITLEKRILWLFWNEVDTWTFTSSVIPFRKVVTTTVKEGTYRATIEYKATSTQGEVETLTKELEAEY